MFWAASALAPPNLAPGLSCMADQITSPTYILPLPQREAFTPNFQEYEIAKDTSRRAIQAAMGISSLPTVVRRDNEKSGIAIGRIQNSKALGSYHNEYPRKLKEMDIQAKLAIADVETKAQTVSESRAFAEEFIKQQQRPGPRGGYAGNGPGPRAFPGPVGSRTLRRCPRRATKRTKWHGAGSAAPRGRVTLDVPVNGRRRSGSPAAARLTQSHSFGIADRRLLMC